METKIAPIKEVFEKDEVKKKFQDMLGKRAQGFMISVVNAVSNDKVLAQAERNSILFAAATAAMLDLPINQNLGLAYIVPYKGKDGIQKAQFQMGYKGFIQLAQRSNKFKSIDAVPVYEGDTDEDVRARLTSIITPPHSSNTVIGYVGYFRLHDGFEKTLYMTIEELRQHGTKYSQSFRKGFGLWKDNFEAMAVKTVLKLLLSKFAPLSTEMQLAVESDQGVVKDLDGRTVDYVDNDNSAPDLEVVQHAKERDRVTDHINKAKTLDDLELAREYADKLDEEDEIFQLFIKKETELSKKK